MLRLVARRALRTPAISRAMCTAVEPSLEDSIAEKIAEVKAFDPAPKAVYPKAALKADLDAGALDMAKFEAAFTDEVVLKKAKSINGEINMLKMKIGGISLETPDWDSYVAEGVPAESVAYYKGQYETLVADTEKQTAAAFKEAFGATVSKIDAAFAEGKSEATKAELAAKAEVEQILAELEVLGTQAANIADQTVAEVLEANPALRAEIEEEFAKHQWGPGQV
jgi:molybdopterin-guanine dinucleotide biosynthesis protein